MPTDPSLPRTTGLIPFAYPEGLSHPEKLLAAYFNSPTVGFCILDSQFRYVAINDTLAKMNGVPPSAHLGRTIRQVLADFANVVEPELRRVFSTGEPRSFSASGVLPAREGVGHWIVQYFPVRDESDVVTRIGVLVVKSDDPGDSLSRPPSRAEKQLQTLLEVSSLLSLNRDARQAFPKLSAVMRRVLRQEYAGLSLYDRSNGLLVREAEDFPLGKGLTAGVPIGSDSPEARAFEERSSFVFSQEQLQGFDAGIAQNYLEEGFQSLCCIPLLRPKGPFGVLVFGSTRKDAFSHEDVTLLNQLAAQVAIALENEHASAEIEALKRRMMANRKHIEGDIRYASEFAGIIGDSATLKHVLHEAAIVAPGNSTVLILGETGTGKELVARAIHGLSPRRENHFVKVNCAAIPTGLLESELFGHEKGAFTGAVNQKVGRLELAHNGTLLLDEVGEIPLALQPKLLRVLQDQEFERLGSTRTLKVNVRIIAATNRDLTLSVSEGQFRSDLYYRLRVFPIHMPSLRDRSEDIPLLVRHFVRKFARRMDRGIEMIPEETIRALNQYRWPGNIRELENLMERSVILSEGPTLYVPLSELHSETVVGGLESEVSLNNVERDQIIRVLRQTQGVVSGPDGAAHRLGLKRSTLQSKMERLRITRNEYLNPRPD